MPRLRRHEAERRQRRRRQLFGPSEGSTSPEFLPEPTVSIQLSNGTWLDVSDDVRYQARIVIRRGRSSRDKRTRAASCNFQLDNRNGKYSPRNPLSPLYGLINRNTPVLVTNRGTIRFWGEIPEWPSTYTTGQKDAIVNVAAAGMLRRLTAPTQKVLKSTLRRTIGNASPVAWWPLDEGTESTTGSSGISGGSLITGTNGGVHFGVYGDLGGSLVEPGFDVQDSTTMTYGGLQGNVPALASTWGCEFAAKSDESAANALIHIALSNGSVIVVFPQFDVFPCQVIMYDFAAGISGIGGSLADAAHIANFDSTVWHYYAFYVQQNGAYVACQFYIDGVLSGSSTAAFASTLTQPVSFLANVGQTGSAITSGGDGTLKSMSSIAFFNGSSPSAGGVAYNGYAGETAGERISRLCSENSIPFYAYGDITDTEPMGPQGVDTLVQLMYDCEDADGGFLFEPREHFGLAYKPRSSLYNQAATVALDHSASGNLDSAPKTRDDDQGIINKSTVNRKNGGSATYELTTGPTGSADPPVGIGLYDEQPTVNVFSDVQLLDIAGWRVSTGSVDELRIDVIYVNIGNMVTNHGLVSLAGSCLSAQVGDRITLDNCPTNWVPPGQQTQLIVGQLETFDQFLCNIDFDSVSESMYHVAVLEDPILGRCESDGTYLSADMDDITSTFNVSIPSGPLWLTTATLPSDFPFDVRCLGERWTVLAINDVGATTQQFVVTRSVNQIAKPQIAGASITLQQPMILAR
jgi:hypothetical protein